jgi:hypothetical protein
MNVQVEKYSMYQYVDHMTLGYKDKKISLYMN